MGLVITTLVLGTFASYLIFSVPKAKKRGIWLINFPLLLVLAVTSYPISEPHKLFSDYIPIENCQSSDFLLEDFTSLKNNNVLHLLKLNGHEEVSVSIDGGLGYWVEDKSMFIERLGDHVSLTQCPYWGFQSLWNMVAQVEVSGKIIYQYRSQTEFEKSSETAKLFGFIGFPLSLVLMVILNVYIRLTD